MKYLILIFTCVICMAKEKIDSPGKAMFKGQLHSVIDWKRMDPLVWLSLPEWKEQRAFRDSYKHWEILKRIERHDELAGNILACYGTCNLYRDENEYRVSFRSKIKEGDEISSGENSIIWIFLLDGSLVRLGPESSITIKEINLLDEKNFINARFNQGNILWLSRNQQEVKESKMRETETLLFPLKLFKANSYTRSKDIPLNEYLFSSDLSSDSQYARLNELITDNNKKFKKPTELFITLPLGSISGENLSLESYTSIGQDNYFKLRSVSTLGLKGESEVNARVNLRGYTNTEIHNVQEDSWYKVSAPARDMEIVEASRELNLNEFITKRIPTFLVARELLLKEKSRFITEKWSSEKLAKEYGYRKWNEKEIKRRIDFLFKNTRNLETSNMVVAQRYRKSVLDKYSEKDKPVVRSEFYRFALANYIQRGEVDNIKIYKPRLNSEKKRLWKRLHGYRSKDENDIGLGKSSTNGTSKLDENPFRD